MAGPNLYLSTHSIPRGDLIGASKVKGRYKYTIYTRNYNKNVLKPRERTQRELEYR